MQQIKKTKIYLMCDKANSNKKGAMTATFPKLLSLYDPDAGEILKSFLDCNSAGNSSEELVRASII